MGETKKAFRVNFLQLVGFSEAENQKILQAKKLWEYCRNQPEFKDRILSFCWPETVTTGVWPFRKSRTYTRNYFRMTEDSRSFVWERLWSGSEVLQPGEDNEADIALTLDRRDAGNVLGYTYSSTVMQWIYSSFFGRATLADIAANLEHEYAHKLGYSHEYNYTTLRQYTVPYAVGYIMKEMAQKALADPMQLWKTWDTIAA